MNSILVSCAGRRVRLVQFFQRALATTGLIGKVAASDLAPEWSSAARVADIALQVPALSDPDYIPRLLDLVQENEVGLLVPTIDTELELLATYRESFQAVGCHAVVSDLPLIQTCRDKRRTETFFQSRGIRTPRRLDRNELTFPCFCKPYDGSLSQGARALYSRSDLSDTIIADDRLLFMEYLAPHEWSEYTVDAYYDRMGRLLCAVPRRRVEIRGGEISKGVTEKGPVLDYVSETLSHVPGARGCLTYQFFMSKEDHEIVAIELNPRFGGGYPLSQAAGVDYPLWLIREYILQEPLETYPSWEAGICIARYDDEVVFRLG